MFTILEQTVHMIWSSVNQLIQFTKLVWMICLNLILE